MMGLIITFWHFIGQTINWVNGFLTVRTSQVGICLEFLTQCNPIILESQESFTVLVKLLLSHSSRTSLKPRQIVGGS